MRRTAVWALAVMLPLSVAAYNPYAPNVFDEVEYDTPGYRGAAALIAGGYAPGYDESLLGQAHLTRFELARALAAALTNPAVKESEDTKAARREYARELAAVGYCDAQAKRDRLRVGGDVRVRTQDDGEDRVTDMRTRLNLTYETSPAGA